MRSDSAASDLVSTLLLVLVAVALGSVLAVAVTSTLSKPEVPAASFSLNSVAAGDARATLLYGDGSTLPLDGLKLTLVRANGTLSSAVPRAQWTTPDARALSPGDAWSVPLSPAAGAGETVRLLVVDAEANAILADVSQRVPGSGAVLPAPALAGNVQPATVAADGATPVLVTLRVSAPAGGLSVASAYADLSGLLAASGSGPATLVLDDAAQSGDATGGDGVWSGLLSVPAATPPGSYAIPLWATDASGASLSAGSVNLAVTADPVAPPGVHLQQGASFVGPTSANATALHVRNWTWDRLHPDRVAGDVLVLRAVGDNGAAWTARVTLDACNRGATPCATGLDVSNGVNETLYVPAGGAAGIPLAGYDLDLLNPLGSSWAFSSGSANPTALYRASGVAGTPVFSVPWLGEDSTKTASSVSSSQGLFAVDVVVS